MIKSLYAEDLFSLILKDLGKTTVTIEFKQVNKWRYELRSHGISVDLGRKEFETLCNHYPHNVYMTQTNIKVILEDKFTKYIEGRIVKYDNEDVKKLLTLWDKAK